MAAAVIAGYKVRGVTHAILPVRDPVFVAVLAAEMAFLVLAFAGAVPLGISADGESLTVSDLGAAVLLCILAFDAGYVLGYVMRDAGDVLILDMPDRTLTYTEVSPLVYYYRDGNVYVMPQTFGGIVASFLGARHPADIPVWEIARRRTTVYSNGIRRPVTMAVIPVSLHETETVTVGVWRFGSRRVRDGDGNVVAEEPRYLWHPEVTSHRIRFSQSVTDDHLAYWVKTDLYTESIRDAVDAEERAARMEIPMQSAKFDAGADLVTGLATQSTDAPGCREEILSRIEEERKRRGGGSDAEHT